MFREGWEIKNFEEYVLNLFKKDEECFEHFKSRCKENGIDVFAAELNPVRDKNDPHQNVRLKIFVIEDHKKYLQNFGSADLVNEHYSKILRTIWFETCKLFNLNLDNFYSERMNFSIRRLDFEYYSYFSRKYKQQIKDIVISITCHEPRYIFASSFGYISIIFDKEQYDRIIKYKMKIIDDILKYTDKMKKILIGNISLPHMTVNIYHPEMKECNMFVLSRED